MPKTLLVPVDCSADAERALRVAEELADHLDACDIVIMHASYAADDDRREYLEHLAASCHAPSVEIETVIGDSAGSIVRLAEQLPDVTICMATHGRGRVGAPLLGSVATEVVRDASVPVLLVGPHCAPNWWHEAPCLIACWAGAGAEPVLVLADDWSNALGMQLAVATVFHPLDRSVSAEPRELFADALRALDSPDGHVSTIVLRDESPAGAIVECAKDPPATLVAMTTHARTGLSRVALESVAMEVTHRSPCPVLVTRRGAGPAR